jgi:putative ABC transport system substrate-binding protein
VEAGAVKINGGTAVPLGREDGHPDPADITWLYANRQLIAELSVKKRLPTMCPYALMGYAVDLAELLRRMADDVNQILKGVKPGDIPIYQPIKFELLINLKTVNALGLVLPPALLARADQVIE